MIIVIIGANGQLGSYLNNKLKNIYKVYAFTKEELDILNSNKVYDTLKNIRPDIVINAAAYTAVDKAESEKELAFLINSKAVENLAEITANFGMYLIHYSTDYVFDGKKKDCYLETDLTNPINIYGQSKLNGEKSIQIRNGKFYIFRVTWLIGLRGRNFVKSIYNIARKNDDLKVVNDQFGVPTTTSFIFDVTYNLIRDIEANHSWPVGIYHATPNGVTNWYEIAKAIILIANDKKKLDYDLNQLTPIPTNKFYSHATRPVNSLLCNDKIKKLISFQIPNWKIVFNSFVIDILNEYEKT